MGKSERKRSGRKHERKKAANQDRDTLRFKGLGDSLKEELEKTGLVEHVKVFCGSLKDRDRNPYIQFRFSEGVSPEDVQRYESDGHELKDRFYNALRKNISEFEGFETVCVVEGVYREFLRLYESVVFDYSMETDIKRRSIEIILEEVKNYNLQR